MRGGSRSTISVVVPVYNDRTGMERCLVALEQQKSVDGDVEIIVVDNGSTDALGPVVDAHPSARLVHEDRPGSYAARNRGLIEARGDVIAFTDADCEPAPSWLAEGLSLLRVKGRRGIVAGPVEVYARDPHRPTVAERYECIFAFPVERYVRELQFGVTANLFVTRSLLNSVGVFDDGLRSGGDAELGQRAHAAGWEIAYAPSAVVRHPARRSTRALLQKARRVAWGREALRARREESRPRLHQDIRRTGRRVIRDIRRVLSEVDSAPERDRLRVALVAAAVQVASTIEAYRCRRAMRSGRAAPRR